MRHNIGALVQYLYLHNSRTHTRDTDIGVVTEVDEFGDHRVVWTNGGIGWYSFAEIEPFNKQETQ